MPHIDSTILPLDQIRPPAPKHMVLLRVCNRLRADHSPLRKLCRILCRVRAAREQVVGQKSFFFRARAATGESRTVRETAAAATRTDENVRGVVMREGRVGGASGDDGVGVLRRHRRLERCGRRIGGRPDGATSCGAQMSRCRSTATSVDCGSGRRVARRATRNTRPSTRGRENRQEKENERKTARTQHGSRFWKELFLG